MHEQRCIIESAKVAISHSISKKASASQGLQRTRTDSFSVMSCRRSKNGCGRLYVISPPSSIFRALPLLTFKRRLGTASMTKTFSCCSPGKFFTSSQAVFSARLLLFSYGEVTSSTAQSSSVKTRSEGILPAEKKANEQERNTLFCRQSFHSAYLPAPFANPNIVLTSPLSNKK